MPLTTMTVEALKGSRGRHVARGGAVEELLRARADVVAVPPPDREDARVHRGEVRQAAGDRRGEHEGVQGRLQLRRDVRGLRRLVRGRAGEARARPLPADHGQPGARVRADRRRRSRSCRSSSARTRSRRPRRSSRSSRATRSSASDLPGRGRDRRLRCGTRRSFGGALGVTTSAGPGIVLKAETVGLGVMLELPLLVIDIQRAGPSTGMPTKPEQADLLMVLFGRNGESPVPVIAASTPGAVLPRRDRGGAHRAQVPHARVPALGRLSGERLRALADPGRRLAARRSRRRSRPARTPATVPPVHARSRDARAAVGGARHAGSRAPDRRAREGGCDRARSRTTPRTTI